MPDVIVLRTNEFGAETAALAERLGRETGRHLAVLPDESKKPVEVPAHVDKIPIRPARLGLLETSDMMWRCGDYCLYEAFAAMPEADAFWLVEPDMRIHATDLRPFFDGEPGVAADLLTGWSVPASPQWGWYEMMRPYAAEVRICMLQLCRFSRAAVAHLFERRIRLGETFLADGLDPRLWPNDEGFVASTLAADGFRIATLDQHAPSFGTRGTFTFTRPTSLAWLARQAPDRRIYHPAVGGEKFLRRANLFLRRLAPSEDDPDPVGRELAAGLREQIMLELAATTGEGEHRAALAALCGGDGMGQGGP